MINMNALASDNRKNPSVFYEALPESMLHEAVWIGTPVETNAVMLFRRLINIDKPVIQARAYIAAEGFIEVRIDGKKLSENVLEPANTDYRKRLLYIKYDITRHLYPGSHAITVGLNRGWAITGKFIMVMRVWYDDGTMENIYTQPKDWSATISPIISATL